jgi:hypothetical protein
MALATKRNVPQPHEDEMPCKRAPALTAALAGALVLAACVGSRPAAADDQADGDFAKRMFADMAGQPKPYACFVRHYDAAHMAQHPLQKVGVMKLLIGSEKLPDDKYLNYSFRLGVNFRDRPGDFDSSGDCGHAPTVRSTEDPQNAAQIPAGIDFSCAVDCDGGGIGVNLVTDNGSVIVKLDSIAIWKGKDRDDGTATALKGGADDKVFRLDRTSLSECAPLAADRKELAALRHK